MLWDNHAALADGDSGEMMFGLTILLRWRPATWERRSIGGTLRSGWPALRAVLVWAIIWLSPDLANSDVHIAIPALEDVTIYCDYDDKCGDSNAGRIAMTELDIYSRPTANRISHALLRFDAVRFLECDSMKTAVLRLFCVSQSEYMDVMFYAGAIEEEWEATEATWCRSTSTSNWSRVGGAPDRITGRTIIPAGLPPGGRWFEWEITEIVRSWIDKPLANHGIRVGQAWTGGHNRNQCASFVSADHSQALRLGPRIDITCVSASEQAVARDRYEKIRAVGRARSQMRAIAVAALVVALVIAMIVVTHLDRTRYRPKRRSARRAHIASALGHVNNVIADYESKRRNLSKSTDGYYIAVRNLPGLYDQRSRLTEEFDKYRE